MPRHLSVEKWDAYSLKRRYKYEASHFIAHYAVRAVAAPIQDDTAERERERGEWGPWMRFHYPLPRSPRK